jgi:hypothetical protein
MARIMPLLVVAAVLVGCGGGDGAGPVPTPRAGATATVEPREREAPRAAAQTGAAAEAVVRGWADELRRGDVDAASARFAVPAVVSNNTPELRLASRDAVRFFNASLPCGGRVTGIVPHVGLLIATFELTDRPGGDCGSGVGATARTAFEIRDGRITRWLRMPDGDDLPAPDGPMV